MDFLKIFFLLAILSCKNPPQEPADFGRSSSGVTDTLSTPDRNYLKITMQLGLKVLSDSNLNEEYRIWLEDASQVDKILLVLKKHGDRWFCHKYVYQITHNENFEVTSVEFTEEKAEPKSDVRSFEAKIKDLRTYQFRSGRNIDGYGDCFGNFGLILESQKNLRYDKFLYPCWTAVDGIMDVDILSNVFRICIEEAGFTFYDKVYEKLKR